MAEVQDRYRFLVQHAYTPTVPAWMGQADTLPADLAECRQGEHASGVVLGRLAYGERAGTGVDAFAYCWRRFGPPWWGCDPTQDIVGYYLCTPHPEVWLRLSLGTASLPFAVGYGVTSQLHAAWLAQRASRRADHPAVCQALYDALVELLRPVPVRDVALTILGRVPEEALPDDTTWDEAPVSPYAGLPVPREVMEALKQEEERHG